MPHPLIIGIAGGSAAGKSTLTQALVDALREQPGRRAAVITSDDYLDSLGPAAPTFVYRTTGERLFNADHPDAIDWAALLRDLDALGAREDAPDVVVLEGHLVLHDSRVRDRMHLRLFVDLDADERVLRRVMRDIQSGRVNPDPVFIANYYRECARVGHAQYIEPSRAHADLIVRGDADWQRLRPLLVAIVAAQLAET